MQFMRTITTDKFDEAVATIVLAAKASGSLEDLKTVISDKIGLLKSDQLELQLVNAQLASDLIASRESEETAYEKLKRLREVSSLRSSICCCLDSVCLQSRLCDATLTSRSVGSNEALCHRIEMLERQVWGGNHERLAGNSNLRCRISHESAPEPGHKFATSIGSRQSLNSSNDAVAITNEVLRAKLTTATKDMEALWNRERSLSQEAATLARMLSNRDEDVANLRQQTDALKHILAQRNQEISHLQHLLVEEQKRSERNRDVAAKVIQFFPAYAVMQSVIFRGHNCHHTLT
jgi:hypothetical protein